MEHYKTVIVFALVERGCGYCGIGGGLVVVATLCVVLVVLVAMVVVLVLVWQYC